MLFNYIEIFCKVVDNFGDAGVCWRLACELHRRSQAAVTLWID
ncbi:MAG: elongation factor P maturation arginine rhamnosyltransferase EarP, partial [Rhodocyclaceae bacterium]|nr:elongation factor P maturation arginine rhamnosyltransferase EarP [Rhodocyclaceae bacterium]